MYINVNILTSPDLTLTQLEQRAVTLTQQLSVVEQSMRINRNCYNAVDGIAYEDTMTKWGLQAKHDRMDRDYMDLVNEEWYLDTVIDNRKAGGELSELTVIHHDEPHHDELPF